MTLSANPPPLIDAATLAAMLGQDTPRLLDARATASAPRVLDARFSLADPQSGAAQYAQGHIEGAVHADLNRDLAVYDAGDGSMAAARAWWMLRLIGHARVAVLDGGLAAWQAAGYPLTTDVPALRGLPPYPGRFDPDQIASVEEISARLKHPPGWLLDARAGERFRGEAEPLDPVAGHVPGAVNRPFALNVHEGRLRPAADLRAALQPLIGTHDPQQVVLMCGSGVTACHLLLAMEVAGLAGARVYPGSWSGWVSDSTRPVATGP